MRHLYNYLPISTYIILYEIRIAKMICFGLDSPHFGFHLPQKLGVLLFPTGDFRLMFILTEQIGSQEVKNVSKKTDWNDDEMQISNDIKEHEPENIGDLFRGIIILMNQLEKKCRYGSFTVTYPNVMFFCVSVKSHKIRTVSSSSRKKNVVHFQRNHLWGQHEN